MSQVNKYVIDFTKAEQWEDISAIIAKGLGFPERYGFNLDILDEFLTDMVLTEKSCVEIRGLENLKKYNGYDKKIYEVFLSAKHSYGTEQAKNLQVKIIREDGSIETLPDDLENCNFILDFSNATEEGDVIREFVNAFEFDEGDVNSFDDVWRLLLQNIFIRISVVEVRVIENLKSIDDTYDTTLKILNGIKEAWNGEYSDRFVFTITN